MSKNAKANLKNPIIKFVKKFVSFNTESFGNFC